MWYIFLFFSKKLNFQGSRSMILVVLGLCFTIRSIVKHNPSSVSDMHNITMQCYACFWLRQGVLGICITLLCNVMHIPWQRNSSSRTTKIILPSSASQRTKSSRDMKHTLQCSWIQFVFKCIVKYVFDTPDPCGIFFFYFF